MSTGVVRVYRVARGYMCKGIIQEFRSSTGVQGYSSTVLEECRFSKCVQVFWSSTDVQWVQEKYRAT